MTTKRPLVKRIAGRMAWEARKVLTLPRQLREALWDTRVHDLKARFGAVTQTAGAIAETRRVTIYVIFPTGGLLESHKVALRYLLGKGNAPVVVANAPLSPEDRAQLLALCWRLIERPNFGYDFGGYRAGVLSLGKDMARLETLTLLNDSVWFPMPDAKDWLAAAEALNVDFVGAVPNYAVPHLPLDRYLETAWDYDPGRPGFHYCSFALWFGRSVLAEPGFLQFWRRFRLTDNKFRTVQRGEVGLSQYLLSKGVSHGETLGSKEFGAEVAQMDRHALEHWIRSLVIPEEPDLDRLGQDVLARRAEADWQDHARAYLLTAAARTGMAYALPEYNLTVHGHPMLKKSPLRLAAKAAQRTMDLLQSRCGTEANVFLAEGKAIVSNRPDRGVAAGSADNL